MKIKEEKHQGKTHANWLDEVVGFRLVHVLLWPLIFLVDFNITTFMVGNKYEEEKNHRSNEF